MTDSSQSPHVLIVGAGIVGLLIAQGLRKHGISFEVFEAEISETHYRPREWGCSIQWGLPMLKDLFTEEKFARIHTAAVDPYHEPEDPGRLPTLNGATGEFIKDVPLNRMYRISRRRFRAFCAEDIPIQYNKALTTITYSEPPFPQTVTATFADGTTATGTLLIGTDGAQSRVRTSIFGPDAGAAQRVPYTAVNLHVCYHDAAKALFVRQHHPIMSMAIHPAGYWLWISIQEVPDPADPATWVFQLQSTWKAEEGEDATSLANLKRRAATYGEPFRSANLWIPEGTRVYENKLSYWVPRAWDTRGGRVLLAGDAAHPMTFQRGQGLNHGIADARSLVGKLAGAVGVDGVGEGVGKEEGNGNSAVQSAVAAYLKEMVDRAGDEVKTSKENTEMIHDWERMAQSPLMQRGGYARGAEVKVAEGKGKAEGEAKA